MFSDCTAVVHRRLCIWRRFTPSSILVEHRTLFVYVVFAYTEPLYMYYIVQYKYPVKTLAGRLNLPLTFRKFGTTYMGALYLKFLKVRVKAVSQELEDFFISNTAQDWVPLLLDSTFSCLKLWELISLAYVLPKGDGFNLKSTLRPMWPAHETPADADHRAPPHGRDGDPHGTCPPRGGGY